MGRIVFGLLAAVSLLRLVGARDPVVSMGHIAALWAVCWLGAKLTERSWIWLPIGIIAFGFAWMMIPILPVIVLFILERVSRPKAAPPPRAPAGPRPPAPRR